MPNPVEQVTVWLYQFSDSDTPFDAAELERWSQAVIGYLPTYRIISATDTLKAAHELGFRSGADAKKFADARRRGHLNLQS